MHTALDKEVDAHTKKAWELNWEDISMPKMMEIFDYARVKKHVEILLKHLPKEGKILEAGCGLCPYLIYLSDQNYDVIGVDYNINPLKKVLSYRPSLSLAVQDVGALGFRDESFTGYLSFGVIEHFTEGPDRALAEASRVLKTGGIAIISVPQKSVFAKLMSPVAWLKQAIKWVLRWKSPQQYWEQYFDIRELKMCIEKHSFKVKEIHALDHDRSLLAFGDFFRNKNTLDEMSDAAIRISRFLSRLFPFATCSAVMFVAEKK